MEEISQYRSRIGIFAAKFCRKSFTGKRKKRLKRSQSPSLLKRKLIKAKNKSKDTAHIQQRAKHRLKYERRPCHLGYFLLLLFIVVTHLSEKPKSYPTVRRDAFEDPSFIAKNWTNSSNVFCICKRHWQQNSICSEKMSSGSRSYFQTYREITDWTYVIPTVNNSAFIHIRHTLFQTAEHNFAPLETSHNVSVSGTGSFEDNHILSAHTILGNTTHTYAKSGIVHNCTSNAYSKTIYFKSSINCYIIIILICLELLACLGTCCYLIGNKGSHSYHGNPEKGDVWLTKKTLALIEEHAHESVGSICIKTFPHGEKYQPYRNYGTGFRAGDKYFITAYHILKEKIEFSLLTKDSEDKKCALHRTLSRNLGEVVDVGKTTFSALEISKLIIKYVKHTYTNIPLLLTTFEGVFDTDTTQLLKQQLNETWKRRCEVYFIKHGKFFVDWKIVFGDEESDIVVIKLIESVTEQMFPRPLLLDENFRQQKDIHIIRYIFGNSPEVVIDQTTRVLENDDDLKRNVDKAKKWWIDRFEGERERFYITNSYKHSCKTIHDEDTGKVVLKASQSFKHGASGSPLVYLFNQDGIPIVGMIYQRGIPDFYYSDKRFKDTIVDSDICLFEGGTTMKHLSKLLQKSKDDTLRLNLFSQPENINTHTIIIKEFRRLQAQIQEIDASHKRLKEDLCREMTPSVDSNKLNTMIEQATARLDYETTQNLYIRTKAHDTADDILNESNIIVITGNPGDGKTALAFQLMKSLCSVKDKNIRRLRPLILSEGTQFDELVKPKNSLCALIDDMFDLPNFSHWNKRLGQLLSAFQDNKDSDSNRLILTLRKDILNSCPPSTKESPLFSDKHILDLSSKQFMTRETMRSLLDAYLPNSEDFTGISNEELDEIMKNSPYIGFPQCCKLAKENKEIKSKVAFFQNPVEFLQKEFKAMAGHHENLHKYVSLVFLLLNPSYLNSKTGTEKAKKLRTFFNAMYGYQWHGKSRLLQSLDAMQGLYTIYDNKNGTFSFSHESIRTSIAFEFGTKHIREYIQYADPQHLYLLVTYNVANKETFSIKMPRSVKSYLMERVTEHLKTKQEQTFKDISNMQVWDDKKFVLDMLKDWDDSPLSISHVDESNRSMLVYFTERGKQMPVTNIIELISRGTSNKDQINLALKAACAIGDEEITLLLLHTDPEPDIYYFINAVKGRNIKILSLLIDVFPTTIEHERAMEQHYSFRYPSAITVLHQACHEGNCDMVKLICSKFSSLATTADNLGHTPLHTSCYKGHTDICHYLIDNFPKLLDMHFTGVLPIHLAAQSGNTQCFDLIETHIRAKYPDIDNYIKRAKTDTKYTIFHAACLSGNRAMCLHISKKYPFIFEINADLALMAVARSGSVDCFHDIAKVYLRRKGKELKVINIKDDNGNTVLLEACQWGKSEMCKYLTTIHPSLMQITNNNGYHCLHAIAESGNINLFKWLLSKIRKDKNNEDEQYLRQLVNEKGQTVLHFACAYGKQLMCQYIADTYPKLINVKTNDGVHILHAAAWSGSIPCLNAITDIVAKNRDLTQRQQHMLKCVDNEGSTIFHFASRNGQVKMCQYIANTYPKLINIRTIDGLHILHEAAWSGSIACLKTITDIVVENQDPTQRQQYMMKCLDNDGSTIFHFASRNGHSQMCEYIANAYPKLINIRKNDGEHILHEAAWSGSVPCLKTIIDIVGENTILTQRQQYMMECVDNVGSTILHSASRKGQIQMCQYIADTYPNLTKIRRSDEVHIFHEAAWSGSVPCLETITDIVAGNQDPSQRQQYMMQCLDNEGSTIFHFASRNGQVKMCQYIANTYPKLINISTIDGVHILHEAAWSGSIPCLKIVTDIVLENQDPPQRQQFMMECLDNDGSTIFHSASRNGQVQMCRYIADTYQCLINIRRNDGVHILHEAAWSGSTPCLKKIIDIVVQNQDLTQRQQYVLECLDNVGATICHYASRKGQLQVFQYIANAYPNLINIRRNDGVHILHEAAWSGSIPCLEKITDIVVENQDPTQRQRYMMECLDNNGATILMYAHKHGHLKMSQYINDTYPKLEKRQKKALWQTCNLM